MKSTVYCDPRINRSALNRFLAHFRSEGDELHTLEVFHHNAMILRLAPSPYSPDDKREIYSLSKSFCSTAVGFLVDEGKLSVEDRVVDLFPECVPENPSENLLKLRVKHVLSMNTGHASCVMYSMIHTSPEDAGAAVRAFMSQPFPYEPGTHFAYNTGATFLLSHIVEKLSGMRLLDFLTWKLFMPLGISDVRWNRAAQGANEGGCGIHVSADDIAKLGLLYLNHGVWNGKRLLSEEWVNAATHMVSDNSGNGSPDWCAGYGYQFWCMAREGYRGDGAFGQLCVVLPEHDMVFAVQTVLGDMQAEIDALMAFADHIFDEEITPAPILLPDYAPVGSEQKTAGFERIFYRLDKNPMGWTGAYFTYDPEADAMRFTFSDGVDQFAIAAGRGHWEESTVYTAKLKPKLVDLMSTPDKERCRMAASYTAEDGKLAFVVRFLNCPHRIAMTFTADPGKLGIHIESWGLQDRDATDLCGTAC